MRFPWSRAEEAPTLQTSSGDAIVVTGLRKKFETAIGPIKNVGGVR